MGVCLNAVSKRMREMTRSVESMRERMREGGAEFPSARPAKRRLLETKLSSF